MFSFSAVRPLFRYGWKLTVSSLLDVGFNNLYGLIIGKFYTKEDLSFVNKGRQLPQTLMENVNGTLGRVAFPALAKIQDDRMRVREMMRRMIICSTFLVVPLMVLMAITARRTILFLYGSNWLPAVPYAQLACFSFALWPFHTINLQAIQAVGRSDVFLRLEIIKKVLSIIVMAASLPFGVLNYMVAYAFVLGPVSVLINAWPNRTLLGYSFRHQITDVLPVVFLSGVIAIPLIVMGTFFTNETALGLFACLSVQAVLFFVFLIGSAYLLRMRALHELVIRIAPSLCLRFPRLSGVFSRKEGL